MTEFSFYGLNSKSNLKVHTMEFSYPTPATTHQNPANKAMTTKFKFKE
jgi:hypothetical protein